MSDAAATRLLEALRAVIREEVARALDRDVPEDDTQIQQLAADDAARMRARRARRGGG